MIVTLLSSTIGISSLEMTDVPKEEKGSAIQQNYLGFTESPTIEEYVRKHFENYPIMADVAECESRFRHFDKNGEIIRGKVNKSDIGVMQINEYYHKQTANKLDISLYTLEGNIEYAKYLFEKEGTAPWLASSKCWGVQNHIAKR